MQSSQRIADAVAAADAKAYDKSASGEDLAIAAMTCVALSWALGFKREQFATDYAKEIYDKIDKFADGGQRLREAIIARN